MIERTDTRRDVIQPGMYDFTVTAPVIKKMSENNKPFYVFEFAAMSTGGKRTKHKEFVMPWMAGPLLRALGCKEVEKDVFEWDKSEVVGRTVKATIVHETDRKDASKTRTRMTNIFPSLTPTEQEPPTRSAADAPEQIPF